MAKLGVDWAELQSCWEKVRDSGHFTEGYFVKAFEEEVSKWCGMEAIAFNSAGTGLYAMVQNVPSSKPSSCAVSNNTFYATGAMPRAAGLEIVLVDCNMRDFTMDYGDLIDRGQRAGMVILTHIGGALARDYMQIAADCRARGVVLLEDAAHALGTENNDVTAGTHSLGAVFSLYPTKAVPAGEGGVVVTKHRIFADRLREYRNYGKYVEDGVLKHRRVGFNFRMDEWTAAVAYLQMKRLPDLLGKRQDAANQLSRIITPWVHGKTNWYKYIVPARWAKEIGIKKFTGKVYQQSDQLVTAMGLTRQGEFPNSEFAADVHVCLPLDEDLYAGMTKDTIIAWLRAG